ncbi:Leukocyte receptor cluster member 8 [Wickerhamomyces ciferrii]|uniref:Leukocyte receptor cluster member 8 n=1 Tax=Wickerhamomyces ciferrii (strain ATCC 14091 / BCRC 22168 / CBS 111 / JCM 3599 / NBRC 0793 / NRRL Y-1031 F-60-10) TaxID=1206466 RepID=K0KJQ1_WICCF|nr:Leukocyte receptor cluster member 8 [Wickerhamomyces ciferrii]CCH41318.1 Leukocyte receptor cluster member 8 [Wickerhamomyces ciferrii]
MSTYNSVTPTALGASRPAAQPAISKPVTNALPQGLTRFVEVCHEKAAAQRFDSKATAQMQLQLKILIEKANNQGVLWENDWLSQELPVFNSAASLELVGKLAKPSFNIKKKLLKRGSSFDSQDDEDELISSSKKKARAARFERELKSESPRPISANDEVLVGDRNKAVKGTCQTLEKSYLRLTSEPDPSKVRPQHILQRALTFILDKYKNGGKYTYVCDQLKSIRQDLRVQLLENPFTVRVYETHGRIALANKDLGEFNQCQSVLKNLYQMSNLNESVNKTEFLSYRILYHILTKNYDSISLIKLKLTPQEKQDPLIVQALQILKAHISNNYHDLFKLYSKTKGTTRDLFKCFIDGERIKALAVICTAYKVLSLEFLLREFNFDNELDCMTFIKDKQIEKFVELRGGDNVVYLNTNNARGTILGLLNSNRRLDIKGQI